MILCFSVHEQTVIPLGSTSVPRGGSSGYLQLSFEFDESWDKFPASNGSRTIFFQKDKKFIPVVLDESGVVDVPPYFTATDEGFMIMLVGISGSVACPTNAISILLEPGGEAWRAEPADLNIPAYQQLVALAQQAVASAAEALEIVANLSFPVTSVNGETGDVTLGAEDIAAQIDGTEAKTVADALVVLLVAIGDLSKLSTEAKDSMVVAINEVSTAAGNAQRTAESAKQSADAAATAAGNAMETAGAAATAAGTAMETAVAANTMAEKAATELSITRNSTGGYTAAWKENGTAKSAKIVGGVGMVKVGTILRIDSHAFLPVFAKAALDGFHERPVMIGDLIEYSGADVTQTFHVGVTTGDEKDIVVNVAHGEVFRVRAVSNYGTDDEYYNVERTRLILPDIGITDRREEWLAWLVAKNPDQTSDADVTKDEVFRFLCSLPDGLHYLDNPSCWGKFWAVNQSGKCVVFAPPDIYMVTTPTNILKLTGSGTLEKYNNADVAAAKSVDLFAASEFAVKDVSDAYAAWEPTDVSKTPYNYVSTLADGSYHIAIGSYTVQRYDVATVTEEGIATKWIFGRTTSQTSTEFTVYCGGNEKLYVSTGGTLRVDGHEAITDAVYPIPTADDVGKIPVVGANGVMVLTDVTNAEEVAV